MFIQPHAANEQREVSFSFSRGAQNTHKQENIYDSAFQEIISETLSKAVLEKKVDGSLNWREHSHPGFSEYRFFSTEERLHDYLRENRSASIWEVEEKWKGGSRIIYKYFDGEDVETFSTKEKLFYNVAALTDYGVFCLFDPVTQSEVYIQQKKGWLSTSYEEVTFEKALLTINARQKRRSLWCKVAAIAIGIISGSAAFGLGRILSRNSVNLPLSMDTLQTTTGLAAAALISSYGMQSPSLALPFALFGVLSPFYH